MSINELMLHPENIPPPDLLRILQERKVKIDGIENMTAQELIQIYNQFCLPQTQRKYKDTFRGKLLSKQQIEREKQVKSTQQSNCFKNLNLNNGKNKINESYLSNSNSDNNKRKCNQIHTDDVDLQPLTKKQRAKITWP